MRGKGCSQLCKLNAWEFQLTPVRHSDKPLLYSELIGEDSAGKNLSIAYFVLTNTGQCPGVVCKPRYRCPNKRLKQLLHAVK